MNTKFVIHYSKSNGFPDKWHLPTLITHSTNTETVLTKHSGHAFDTWPNVSKFTREEAVNLLRKILGDGLDVLVLRNRHLQQPGRVVVHPVDQLGPVFDGVPFLRVLKSAQAVFDSANNVCTFSLDFFNSFRHCKIRLSAWEDEWFLTDPNDRYDKTTKKTVLTTK